MPINKESKLALKGSSTLIFQTAETAAEITHKAADNLALQAWVIAGWV